MGRTNFNRTYVMKFGKNGGSGYAVGNVNGPESTALHIAFSVERSDAEASNTGTIEVWNLSDTTLRVLDEEDCIVDLVAGYGDNMAPIIIGNVTSVSTYSEGADRITEIEVVDGRVALRDTYVTLSFNGIVNSQQLYQQIADAMGVTIVYGEGVVFKGFPYGFSFIGKAREALKKIAQYNNHSWTLQNGVLQVTLPGMPVSTKGYLLSADTGLIGIPKRITLAADSKNAKGRTGWEVQYFMNAAINVNDVVELRSRVATGYYRVQAVAISGDNMKGDWICKAELLEVQSSNV